MNGTSSRPRPSQLDLVVVAVLDLDARRASGRAGAGPRTRQRPRAASPRARWSTSASSRASNSGQRGASAASQYARICATRRSAAARVRGERRRRPAGAGRPGTPEPSSQHPLGPVWRGRARARRSRPAGACPAGRDEVRGGSRGREPGARAGRDRRARRRGAAHGSTGRGGGARRGLGGRRCSRRARRRRDREARRGQDPPGRRRSGSSAPCSGRPITRNAGTAALREGPDADGVRARRLAADKIVQKSPFVAAAPVRAPPRCRRSPTRGPTIPPGFGTARILSRTMTPRTRVAPMAVATATEHPTLRTVFGTPGVTELFATSILARTPGAAVGVVAVLRTRELTGSFAAGGAAAAAYALANGVTAPALARLVDRTGQRAVLAPARCWPRSRSSPSPRSPTARRCSPRSRAHRGGRGDPAARSRPARPAPPRAARPRAAQRGVRGRVVRARAHLHRRAGADRRRARELVDRRRGARLRRPAADRHARVPRHARQPGVEAGGHDPPLRPRRPAAQRRDPHPDRRARPDGRHVRRGRGRGARRRPRRGPRRRGRRAALAVGAGVDARRTRRHADPPPARPGRTPRRRARLLRRRAPRACPHAQPPRARRPPAARRHGDRARLRRRLRAHGPARPAGHHDGGVRVARTPASPAASRAGARSAAWPPKRAARTPRSWSPDSGAPGRWPSRRPRAAR